MYVGVGGGGGIDFFGMGEEMNWELLIGGEYSHTSTATTESGTGWGIDVAAGDGPPQSTDPTRSRRIRSVCTFCPRLSRSLQLDHTTGPRTHGPSKLIDCLKQSTRPGQRLPHPPLDPQCIDPGGAAWQICFVVTDYQTVDNQHYHYTGPGAAPSPTHLRRYSRNPPAFRAERTKQPTRDPPPARAVWQSARRVPYRSSKYTVCLATYRRLGGGTTSILTRAAMS